MPLDRSDQQFDLVPVVSLRDEQETKARQSMRFKSVYAWMDLAPGDALAERDVPPAGRDDGPTHCCQ